MPKSASSFGRMTDEPLPRPRDHQIDSKEALTALRATPYNLAVERTRSARRSPRR